MLDVEDLLKVQPDINENETRRIKATDGNGRAGGFRFSRQPRHRRPGTSLKGDKEKRGI